MFINKEGKLFGKVSIVDIFVIFVILIAAFGVYTRFFTVKEAIEVEENQIEYQLRIPWVREATYNALLKKGIVMDAESEEKIGEIVDIQTEEIFEEQTKSDGSLVNALVPDRLNVIVTVRSDGYISDAGYFAGAEDKRISVGADMTFATKYVETSGKVISVEEVK